MFPEMSYLFPSQITRIDISNLQEGLEPEVLEYGHRKVGDQSTRIEFYE